VAADLKIIEQSAKIVWNFEEVKAELRAHVEKYVGLVVNDDNLKGMEATQKEIAALRLKVSKFRLAVKAENEKPYLAFEVQAKELLKLIEDVEVPIKDQILKYEDDRREKKRVDCVAQIASVAAELSLNEEYVRQIVVDEKWLLRGAKKGEVKEAIQMRVCWFLDIQRKAVEAATFKAQKIEMAKFMIESLSVGLISPLKFEDIENRIDSLDIGSLKANIEAEVAKRRDREAAAAEAAVIKAAAEAKAAEDREIAITNKIAAGVQAAADKAMADAKAEEIKQEEVNLAPIADVQKVAARFDVQLDLIFVTAAECKVVEALLRAQGIEYRAAVKKSVA